jgi:hypothetical protein
VAHRILRFVALMTLFLLALMTGMLVPPWWIVSH